MQEKRHLFLKLQNSGVGCTCSTWRWVHYRG